MGRATLIVRTRVAGWNQGVIRYDVKRVIHGDSPGLTVLVDYSGPIEALGESMRDEARKELAHEPTSVELESHVLRHSGIEKGKEMILYLSPRSA